MPRLATSLTLMFQEWDLLERFAIARRVGFRGVEIQAPYGESAEAIAERLGREALAPVLLNTPVAVAALPGRESEFQAGVEQALDYAVATGCRQLHCLAGATDADRAEDTFVANLRWASACATRLGVRLLIEPLNTHDNPGYFLTGSAQARRILERVGDENVSLQYDVYHMQIMEGNLAETLTRNIDVIGHVQIGGVPGRHEPDDSQEVHYRFVLDLLDDLGYQGWVGCEYRPRAGTVEGLGWARRYNIGPPGGRPV